MTARRHCLDQRPPPPPATHGTAHGTPLMHWEVLGRARMQPRTPMGIAAMSDSDGSPNQDGGHHRQSRSRSPVPPACAGETTAEREELRLAEAAVLVRPAEEQPQAAPSNPEPPAPVPVPAREAAPAAQAAAPGEPPQAGAPDAQGAATAAPASHVPASGTPPARGTGPARASDALPRTAAAAAESREGAKYHPHTNPSCTHVSSLELYPPRAEAEAFLEGTLWPVRATTSRGTPMGITLPQRQRLVVQARVGGDRAGRVASQGCAGQGTEGNGGKVASGGGGQAPGVGKGAGSSAMELTQGKGQGARRDGGRQGHGQGTSASSSGEKQTHGKGKGTGSAGRDTGHGRAHRQGHGKDTSASGSGKSKGAGDRGRGAGGRGRTTVRTWGQVRGPGARKGGVTWATAGRQDGARGGEGRRSTKDRGRGAESPRSQTSRRCGASPELSSRYRRTTPTTTTSPSTTLTPI